MRGYKSIGDNPFTTRVDVDGRYVDGECDLFHLLGIETKVFNPNPFGFTNGEDCSVRAVCALLYAEKKQMTEEDYQEVYRKLASTGARLGRIMNHIWVIAEFLKEHGYAAAEPKEDVTVGSFLCTHKTGRYVISFDIHVYAYINGVIYDIGSMFEADETALGHYIDVVYCPEEEAKCLFR